MRETFAVEIITTMYRSNVSRKISHCSPFCSSVSIHLDVHRLCDQAHKLLDCACFLHLKGVCKMQTSNHKNCLVWQLLKTMTLPGPIRCKSRNPSLNPATDYPGLAQLQQLYGVLNDWLLRTRATRASPVPGGYRRIPLPHGGQFCLIHQYKLKQTCFERAPRKLRQVFCLPLAWHQVVIRTALAFLPRKIFNSWKSILCWYFGNDLNREYQRNVPFA